MSDWRDPALPGLEEALDPQRARDRLERALPECRQGLVLEQLKIYSVHYVPGQRCAILYSARFRRPRGGRRLRQPLAGLLLPRGEAPPTASEVPPTQLDDLGMTVYPWPRDPALPTLAAASDPVTMRRELGRALASGRDARPGRLKVERLGYTPFARAALGYELDAPRSAGHGERPSERSTGDPERWRLVGKIDASRPAERLFRHNWAVWHAAGARIDLVPPVDYLPLLELFLQRRIDGVRLTDLAADARFVEWARRTGDSIATFHGIELPLRGRRAPKHEAAAVRRWGRVLQRVRPAASTRVRKLCKRIAADLDQHATITGPIHADLHPANVMVSGDRVVLIDIDNVTLGDCLLDVGRFLSALRTSSLRIHGQPDRLSHAGDAFLETYLSRTGQPEARARLFEAACLITSAGTGFRLQREGWQRSADLLIDEAERALDRSRRGHLVRSGGVAVTACPAAVRLASATDERYMRAALHDPVLRCHGVTLSRCRVRVRREDSREVRLRYDVAGPGGGAMWRGIFEGVLRKDGLGRGAARRLSAVAAALAGSGLSLLPRPVVFLPELGLRVQEPPAGVPPTARLGHGVGSWPERLAEALALLQRAEIGLDRTRPLAEELATLERRIDRVERTALETRARRTHERVARCLLATPELSCPVLRGLSPDKLRIRSDRSVVLTGVADVVLGHPCLDPADLLARLRVAERRRAAAGAPRLAAERFRRRYLLRMPAAEEKLDAFEAAALLREACDAAWRGEPAAWAEALIAGADALLDRCDPAHRPRAVRA